jgi:hypothetical protein
MNICYSCKEITNLSVINFSCNHKLCIHCIHRSIITSKIDYINTIQQREYSCLCYNGTVLLNMKDIKSLLVLSLNDSSKPLCQEHNKEYKQFCFDCRKGICKECLDATHSSHDTGNLKFRCSIHNSKFVFSKKSVGKLMCKECTNNPNGIVSYDEYKELLKNKVSLIKTNLPPINENIHRNSLTNLTTKIADLFEILICFLQKIRDNTLDHINELNESLQDAFIVDELLIKKYYQDINNLQDNLEYGGYFDQPLYLPNLDFPSIDHFKRQFEVIKKQISNFGNGLLNVKSLESNSNNCHMIKEQKIDNSYDIQILIPKNNIIREFDHSINETKHLDGHINSVLCLTKINEDLIASGSVDSKIKIWNIRSNECIKTLEEHNKSVYTLAVLQNGFLASGSADKTIGIWNKDYTCIKKIEEHKSSIYSLLALNNKWLVSGSGDRLIKVFDSEDNFKCIYTLEGHNRTVMSIKQLSNNYLVSISSDQYIIIWSFTDQFRKVKEWDTGSSGYSLCILSNNKIASGHQDNIIRIWDTSTMECLSKLEGHTNWVCALLLLSNGYLVSSGWNNEVIVWKPTNDSKVFKEEKNICNDGGYVYSMIETFI